MRLLAIDPGPEESAWVIWDGERLEQFAKEPNDQAICLFRNKNVANYCVIEQVASYGMPVGKEIFETCVWTGRFMEAFSGMVDRIPRLDVKIHHCHSAKANDSTIRKAIIDRFGGKDKAIGSKANPGMLYGVTKDVWAALALALCWYDSRAFRDAAKKAGRV